MLLVRALNSFDIEADPLTNGIASKKMIYDLTKRYYENNRNSKYKELSEEEKDIFIREHIEEYLRSHNHKLEKLFVKNSSETREDVREYKEFLNAVRGKSKEELTELARTNYDGLNFGSYIKFKKYLSTLQQHLLLGSSKTTDWISTSTDLGAIKKFYDQQDIHKVAVIRTNTGGLIDSDNILTVDISSKDMIERNKYLCNKIDIDEDIIDVIAQLSNAYPSLMLNFGNRLVNRTNEKARGYSYSKSAKEMCILRYIPKDHIVSVLDALQVELVYRNLFNYDFFKLSKEEQKKELERLRKVLQYRVDFQQDPFIKHVFEELFIENKNERTLGESEERINHEKAKILHLARDIPNANIKI